MWGCQGVGEVNDFPVLKNGKCQADNDAKSLACLGPNTNIVEAARYVFQLEKR